MLLSDKLLSVYYKQARRQLSVKGDLSLCDPAVLAIGHQVRQVDYWATFLAYRQEPPCLDWHWKQE